jgi:hypothetical protein
MKFLESVMVNLIVGVIFAFLIKLSINYIFSETLLFTVFGARLSFVKAWLLTLTVGLLAGRKII